MTVTMGERHLQNSLQSYTSLGHRTITAEVFSFNFGGCGNIGEQF